MSIIACKNLSFRYESKIVLENINFELDTGGYLLVLGENGAGKTTLIKGLLNLKKPLKGEFTLGDKLEKNQIGYLPQQTDIQKDFPASVFEVVLSGRLNSKKIFPFYTKTDREIAIENLKLMGIEDIRKKSYQKLSGGQQQKVLLARAMCATQKMLVLDEPVSGLDPVATRELYKLIEKINKELKITIIMVSHDVEAIDYSSHILHLSNKQIYFGESEKYKNTEIGKMFLYQRRINEDNNTDSSGGKTHD